MLAINVIGTYFEYQKNSDDYLFFDNRTYLPVVVQSVCAFYMASFVKLPDKIENITSYIGSCTFGIYLVSDMFIRILRPEFKKVLVGVNPLFAIILLEICVFLLGLAVVSLLKKLPLIKKVL